jgi:hypothetical protein
MKPIVEAFQAGTAGKVLGQFIRVLGRKTRKEFMVSPIKYDYKNQYGKFSGFFALYNDGAKAIRINFRLRESDEIYSIDYYKKPSHMPTYTLVVEGFNIVQILNTVSAMVLGKLNAGAMMQESAGLREARDGSLSQQFDHWMSAGGAKIIKTSKYPELWKSYQHWAKQTKNVEMSTSMFRYTVNNYLKASGTVAKGVPVGTVVKGKKDVQLTPDAPDIPFPAKKIADEKDDHKAKYDQLTLYCKILASDNSRADEINGLFIAGKAGMGKTESVKPIFEALGKNVKTLSGGGGSPTALMQALWKYSSYELCDILIFDDLDTILDPPNGAGVNILKKAMESTSKPRHVVYLERPKKGDFDESNDFYSNVDKLINEAGRPGTKPVSAGIGLDDDDLADADDDDGTGDDASKPSRFPTEGFAVKPKIVFISNRPSVPAAIDSRCLQVTFKFTMDQTIDVLEDIMDTIIDPSGLQDKWKNITALNFRVATKTSGQEVLEYIRDLEIDDSDALNIRQLKFAMTIWSACKGDEWKKWIRLSMRRI